MQLELNNISLTYAISTPYETKALSDVSFSAKKGEFIAVMGQTGSGKSTLLKIIAGLEKPSSGTVFFNGEDINAYSYNKAKLRSYVGMVFQNPEYQLFESSVYKDVAFGLKHAEYTKDEKHRRVKNALETVGFEFDKIKDLSPLALSGGEKRRVAIAGVLAAEPELILFDEPVAGLDPVGRNDFVNTVKKLNKAGITIIMVSHNADAIAECAERILIFDNTKLIKDAPAAKVFADSKTLKNIGLEVNGAKYLADLLKKRGMCIDDKLYRYEEIVKAVAEKIKNAGVGK